MANNLNTEITGRWVVIKEGSFKPEYKPLHWRIWRAEGGFGCHSFTRGNAVMATAIIDGEQVRWEGYDIERFATDEEIAICYAEYVARRTEGE